MYSANLYVIVYLINDDAANFLGGRKPNTSYNDNCKLKTYVGVNEVSRIHFVASANFLSLF